MSNYFIIICKLLTQFLHYHFEMHLDHQRICYVVVLDLKTQIPIKRKAVAAFVRLPAHSLVTTGVGNTPGRCINTSLSGMHAWMGGSCACPLTEPLAGATCQQERRRHGCDGHCGGRQRGIKRAKVSEFNLPAFSNIFKIDKTSY